VEFRDYIAILGGLIGILATFTGIMWMLVQQINKRIDTVEKRIDDRINAVEKRIDDLRDDVDRRFGELREEIKGLREEIKEIRLLLYKVLEVPHKQGE
jgi:F0F1-type ATP synthase membrane subunit b/b'